MNTLVYEALVLLLEEEHPNHPVTKRLLAEVEKAKPPKSPEGEASAESLPDDS